MSLVVNSDEDAFIRIVVQSGPNKGFQFKTHPNIDKNLYGSANVLGLKDPSRPFPTGSELGILKWRMQTKDESLVPLSINCWPSVSGGESYVNIEYESSSDLDLQNVTIVIPLPPSGHAPTVNQVGGRAGWAGGAALGRRGRVGQAGAGRSSRAMLARHRQVLEEWDLDLQHVRPSCEVVLPCTAAGKALLRRQQKPSWCPRQGNARGFARTGIMHPVAPSSISHYVSYAHS